MAGHPLRSAIDRRLGEPLPHQQANRPRAPLQTVGPCGSPPLIQETCDSWMLRGISTGFPMLSPIRRQIAHVLLTRSPLASHPKAGHPFDLHALSTPPAFVLSQDQTLHCHLILATKQTVLVVLFDWMCLFFWEYNSPQTGLCPLRDLLLFCRRSSLDCQRSDR